VRLNGRANGDPDEGAEGRLADCAVERGATKKEPADGRREHRTEITAGDGADPQEDERIGLRRDDAIELDEHGQAAEQSAACGADAGKTDGHESDPRNGDRHTPMGVAI